MAPNNPTPTPAAATCTTAGCSNPATTTALDTGAPVCRKCADTAARDWESEQREADTIDALDELLPSGQVPPAIGLSTMMTSSIVNASIGLLPKPGEQAH
jgi:hypothetical protein